MGVLVLALLATSVGLVIVDRDRAEARREADALRSQLEEERTGSADAPADVPSAADPSAPQGDGPSTPAPNDTAPQGDGPSRSQPAPKDSGALQDLLDQLMGGSGMGNIDPSCVADLAGGGVGQGGKIEGDVRQQVAAIAPLVEQQRGLHFDHAVVPEFLPSDEFEARLAKTVEKDYPAAQADLEGRVLGLLGAVPKGTDMKALEGDLLTGQVAGYYDPETEQIVVRVPDGGGSLDANGQVTLAHELDHALTDQAIGLPSADAKGQSDANLAQLGLVEGDATLLMEQFSLHSIGLMDQLGAALSPDALAAQGQLDGVPPYLRNQLMFPYLSGLSYVCRLYTEGGWPAVDAAYRDLPGSTAEILYPEDAGLTPVNPRDPGSPGAGWTTAQTDTLGAAQLLWLFQAPGGDEKQAIQDAEAAARHWAGGEMVLSTDGDRSALGVALVDGADGGTLCSAVEDWYSAAFDASRSEDGGATVMSADGQVGVLRCNGREVRLGIAPDATAAAAMAQ
ncbi:MAG TPA: hypothetical protein VID93_00110 [Acidimicrobiales bacterium]